VRQLVRCGALDGIAHGLTRPQILWSYLRRRREGELFAPEAPPRGDYPEQLKLLDELRTLGLMVSRHPVALFRSAAADLADRMGLPAPIPSSRIPGRVGREVTLVGLAAAGKEALTRRPAGSPAEHCETLVFISFEDEYSLFETVLFPPVFRRHRHCIEGGGVMLVCGRVQQEMGAYTVSVRWVGRPGSGRGGTLFA
ncbi:MAG: hypothetical protein JXB06_00050, partial [Spirochaetales bacterium]|nr:hypothetical protein [Spirochaetales bacterium]